MSWGVSCLLVTAKKTFFFFLVFRRLEDFLVPELQATEEEKNKLESGLSNGDEPMDQDLSVLPTKCISNVESLEIRSVKSERKSVLLYVLWVEFNINCVA